MKGKIELSVLIPAIAAIISLLVLIFGNNIHDRYFNDANLLLQTSKTNQFVPNDMVNITDDYFLNQKNKTAADTLRIVRIENQGATSKKLRIQLNLDGPIYDYNIESSETIKDNKIETGSTIVINMDRMSKNSVVELKIWLKDDNRIFSSSYSDEISNKEILNKSRISYEKKTIFFTTITIIFLESILFIFINFSRNAKLKRKDIEDKVFLDKMLGAFGDSLIEDDTEKEADDNKDNVQSSKEKEQIQERLREFIKKNTQ